MNKEECCGTCKYHRYDDKYQDWVCTNEQSAVNGCATDYEDSCSDWEEK